CSRACSHISAYAPICPPTICFSPPKNPCPIVGDRTMMPRTRPLYSAMRYPSMENVVVVSSVSDIMAPKLSVDWRGDFSMPPNGSRLSCGARLKSSQMEFYYTGSEEVHRIHRARAP